METIKNEKIKVKVLILGFLVSAITVLSATMSFDPDLLWHYKLGEQIVSSLSVSVADTFSWQSGLIWTQHEWLYDVMIYGIIKYTGATGFKLLYILNYTAIILYGYKLNCKGYKPYQIFQYITIASLIILTVPMNRFNRPAELSAWFLVIMMNMHLNPPKKYRKIKYLLFGLLAINFHGGSVIVIIPCWLILIALELIFDKIEHSHIKRLDQFKDLLLFLVGTLANPLGYKMIPALFVVKDMGSTSKISEWEPLEISLILGIILTLLILSMGHALSNNKFKRQQSKIIALLCALLILTFKSTKAGINFAVLYIIFGYPCTHIFLTDLWSRIFTSGLTKHEYEERARVLQKRHIKFKTIVYTISPALVVVLIFASFTIIIDKKEFNSYVYGEKGVGFSEDSQILQYLKDTVNTKSYETSESNTFRIVHGYVMGGYLIYNGIPCFIDARQTPYESYLDINTSNSMETYYKLIGTRSSSEVSLIFEQLHPTYIITSNELDISWYLEEHTDDWELLFEETWETMEETDKPICLWRYKKSGSSSDLVLQKQVRCDIIKEKHVGLKQRDRSIRYDRITRKI